MSGYTSATSGLTLCIGPAKEFCEIGSILQYELQPRVVVRLLRGQNMSSSASLFNEFAAALQFPCYFGFNWNAFDECIADLAWLPGRGYVLLIVNGGRVLHAEPDDTDVFFRMITSVSEEWATVRGLPFRTFLQCSEEESNRIRASIAVPSDSIDVSDLKTTVCGAVS